MIMQVRPRLRNKEKQGHDFEDLLYYNALYELVIL